MSKQKNIFDNYSVPIDVLLSDTKESEVKANNADDGKELIRELKKYNTSILTTYNMYKPVCRFIQPENIINNVY